MCGPYPDESVQLAETIDGPTARLEWRPFCCVVQMYLAAEASKHDFVPIMKSLPEPWELRVVIWECEKIVSDSTPDVFFSVEFQCSSSDKSELIFPSKRIQESNVHYGARGGRGEFNYRFKFAVRVPCTLPRMKVKVWNRRGLNPVGTNAYLAEANIELEPIFRAAAITRARQDRPRASIKLYHPDYRGDVRGKVDMQLSLVDEEEATEQAVGYGRGEPNRDPYLPPLNVEGKSFFDMLTKYLKMLACLLVACGLVYGGLVVMGVV